MSTVVPPSSTPEPSPSESAPPVSVHSEAAPSAPAPSAPVIPGAPSPAPTPVDRTVLAAHMGAAVQAIERWARRTLHRDSGTSLSRNETHLLAHLATLPPQRMGELAQWQGVDRSTMSVQIRSLGERELVDRSPDPADRRASTVTLSAEGRAMLEKYLGRASQILELTFSGRSDQDLARFDGYLARFAADLGHGLADDQAPSGPTGA